LLISKEFFQLLKIFASLFRFFNEIIIAMLMLMLCSLICYALVSDNLTHSLSLFFFSSSSVAMRSMSKLIDGIPLVGTIPLALNWGQYGANAGKRLAMWAIPLPMLGAYFVWPALTPAFKFQIGVGPEPEE
jgi:hypothetical protein